MAADSRVSTPRPCQRLPAPRPPGAAPRPGAAGRGLRSPSCLHQGRPASLGVPHPGLGWGMRTQAERGRDPRVRVLSPLCHRRSQTPAANRKLPPAPTRPHSHPSHSRPIPSLEEKLQLTLLGLGCPRGLLWFLSLEVPRRGVPGGLSQDPGVLGWSPSSSPSPSGSLLPLSLPLHALSLVVSLSQINK